MYIYGVYLQTKSQINKTNKMRKAINSPSTIGQYLNFGSSNQQRITTKVNNVAIDNVGSMPVSSFINRLFERGRIGIDIYKKRHQMFSDEFLTELLNKNEDLFPANF